MSASARPVFEGSLYGDAVIRHPSSVFKSLRDLGSAVWLPKRRLWAISRFADVRNALRADDALISGKGVAANTFANSRNDPLTLTSDGETHLRRRRVLIRPVMPRPLQDLRPRLEGEADKLVSRLADQGEFEVMSDFASHLPVGIVSELVGLNASGRKRMLSWAAATFNALGIMNLRGLASLPRLMSLSRFVSRLGLEDVTPDGWAARLFKAADKGEITRAEANAMVIDYVAPALDTTILATGEMVYRLANTEGAFDAVRTDSTLIPGVVNESVRLASPIRGFTRSVVADYDVGGQIIPEGSRVVILYASANRDERHYDDPDGFDVNRNPRDHVGWGHGPHACVGMHLARLEMEVLLEALTRQIREIRAWNPVLLRNNVLQGFSKLSAEVRT